MKNFERICALAAARQCYEAGQSVEQIAKSAERSTPTIRKWLKVTQHLFLARKSQKVQA